MNVNDITYDIDNVDLEKEMIIQDIEEEIEEAQNMQEIEEEKEEKKQQLENEKSFFESRRVLNTKNLTLDLDMLESQRPKYKWYSTKDEQFYEGNVVYKLDKDTYIFNCLAKNTNDFKLKKFNLNNIEQIKK